MGVRSGNLFFRWPHKGQQTLGYGVIGSTSDSGSFSLGSSPSTPAIPVVTSWPMVSEAPIVSWPRTPPSHGGNTGSNPVGSTSVATPGFPGGRSVGPPSSSGPGRRPLTAVTRVQIPLGVLFNSAWGARPCRHGHCDRCGGAFLRLWPRVLCVRGNGVPGTTGDTGQNGPSSPCLRSPMST